MGNFARIFECDSRNLNGELFFVLFVYVILVNVVIKKLFRLICKNMEQLSIVRMTPKVIRNDLFLIAILWNSPERIFIFAYLTASWEIDTSDANYP